MSKKAKQPYIKIQQTKTAKQFLDALSLRNSSWGTHRDSWAFRGHANADWVLLPKFIRENSEVLKSQDAEKLANKEYRSIMEFSEAADRVGLLLPEDGQHLRVEQRKFQDYDKLRVCLYGENRLFSWPPDDLLSLYGLAQHYGIGTRLLDWSWNPQVAMYFAASEACREIYKELINEKTTEKLDRNHIAVWAFQTAIVHKVWIPMSFGANADREHFSPPRFRVIRAPQATNSNLQRQAGLFTLDADLLNVIPFEKYLPSELETNKFVTQHRVLAHLDPPFLRKVTLPYKQTPQLMKLLSHEGTTAARIFAGPMGAAKSVEEKRIWEELIHRDNNQTNDNWDNNQTNDKWDLQPYPGFKLFPLSLNN